MDCALVSQFVEITSCDQAYAFQQLSSCQWNMEKAVNLFFTAGGVVTGASPSDAAPSPPVQEEENEVRAPIPSRVERLCDDSYYYGSRCTDCKPRSMWDPPSPKPVPTVPVQASGWGVAEHQNADQVQASGWGGVEPHGVKSDGIHAEEQVTEIKLSGWGEAEPGKGSDVEDEKFNQETHDDQNAAVYGMSSEEEQDGDDKEDQATDSVNDDENGEEQDDVSDYDDEIEDYGYDMAEDDDGYQDLLMEDEEQDQAERPRQSLADMYRLPFDLMYRGTFHYAKVHAATQDRFLLVNIQTQDFASCLLNRDLWANSVVSQAVKENFVFQMLEKMNNDYGDESTKVCSFYKVQDDQLPVLLVLDPITGQMLAKMSGAMTPDEFMVFTEKYRESKPCNQSRPKIVPKTTTVVSEGCETVHSGGEGESAATAEEGSTSPGASVAQDEEDEPVPLVAEVPAEVVDSEDDEPTEGERMFKLRVRFPDGTVVSKEFGGQRRVSKLFAYCRLAIRDVGKTEQMAFRIMRIAGCASKELQNSAATFEELGLNFATVSVVFVN